VRENNRRFIEAALWFFCLIFCIPILMVVVQSFKSFQEVLLSPASWPSSFSLANYEEVWVKTNFPLVFGNTLFIAGISIAGILLFCSMAGYRLSRTRTRLSAAVLALIVLALMIPFEVIMVPLVKIASMLHIYNSLSAVVLINIGFSCPLAVLLYHGFTNSIPVEIEEAAIIDGCSQLGMYFRVILPLLLPVSATVGVLYFLNYWNDLTLPLIMLADKAKATITLSQLQFFNELVSSRWNLLLTAGVMAFLPVIIIYLFCQKYIINGLTSGAVK